jgi:hypothetical protein
MNWIKDHWGTLAAVAVVAVLAGVMVAFYDPTHGAGDPEKNRHAAACVDAHNTIKQHNHGGRDQSVTLWCVDSDGRITDIWFS